MTNRRRVNHLSDQLRLLRAENKKLKMLLQKKPKVVEVVKEVLVPRVPCHHKLSMRNDLIGSVINIVTEGDACSCTFSKDESF
jgi:hypothetical protein